MAEACYKPKYIPASFKGVPFEALDSSSEHGRRGAEGEFPFGESTAYADLGRKIRRYTISGRFAANSHIADAAALIAVCEMPGPGVLVHPTRGAVTVACTSLSVRDNPIEEQGVTYFDADFVEANIFGAGLQFGGLLGGLDLSTIIGAVGLFFQDSYKPDAVRWYNSLQVANTGAEAVAKIAEQYNKVTSNSRDVKVYQLLNNFNTVVNDPFTVRNPETLYRVIVNGMGFVDTASAAEAKVAAFKSIANWAAKASSLAGEAGISEGAVYTAVRILAAGYMTRGILESTTTTLDAALTEFDMVSKILAEEAEVVNTECADPRLYMALRDFTITIQATLLHRAYELPALVSYQFAGPTHPLVAAYEIYDDATRFRDLETRNPQYLPWTFGPAIVASRRV